MFIQFNCTFRVHLCLCYMFTVLQCLNHNNTVIKLLNGLHQNVDNSLYNYSNSLDSLLCVFVNLKWFM